jgi:ubiquinol-cytochrome c reductase cytochrome b subunit
VLQAAVVVLPFAAFMVTKRLCLALQDDERERLAEGEETGYVRQTVEGGYEPVRVAASRSTQ